MPYRVMPHLLIIRFSSMGDVAMTVPVVRALRDAYPDLRITVLTRSTFKPFFRGIAGLEFLDPDFKGRHKGMAGMIRLYRDVQTLGITHVADLHNIFRTRLIGWLLRLSGRRVAAVDKGRTGKRELTRKFRKVKMQLKPAVERYADTLRDAGFPFPDPVPMENPLCATPGQILSVAGEKSGTWIGISPFARHLGRTYPTNLAGELIAMLASEYDRVFVFGKGPYERQFADYMAQCHPNVISVIEKLDLEREIDLMSNLDAMISMDSSAMHMASLVGTPVVSVWGATHPFAGSYGFGQDYANAVQLDLSCRPCSLRGEKSCIYKDYRCMAGISPHLIMFRLSEVLKK